MLLSFVQANDFERNAKEWTRENVIMLFNSTLFLLTHCLATVCSPVPA